LKLILAKRERERQETKTRVTLEFGRYLERKFIPPNSGCYKPIPLKKNLALEIQGWLAKSSDTWLSDHLASSFE
jgi:hypothetical protein